MGGILVQQEVFGLGVKLERDAHGDHQGAPENPPFPPSSPMGLMQLLVEQFLPVLPTWHSRQLGRTVLGHRPQLPGDLGEWGVGGLGRARRETGMALL